MDDLKLLHEGIKKNHVVNYIGTVHEVPNKITCSNIQWCMYKWSQNLSITYYKINIKKMYDNIIIELKIYLFGYIMYWIMVPVVMIPVNYYLV